MLQILNCFNYLAYTILLPKIFYLEKSTVGGLQGHVYSIGYNYCQLLKLYVYLTVFSGYCADTVIVIHYDVPHISLKIIHVRFTLMVSVYIGS